MYTLPTKVTGIIFVLLFSSGEKSKGCLSKNETSENTEEQVIKNRKKILKERDNAEEIIKNFIK